MIKSIYNPESKNCRKYLEPDGSPKPEALQENPWLGILAAAEEPLFHPEQMLDLENWSTTPLGYVLRTFDILDEIMPETDSLYPTIRTALAWAVTAKGGTEEERARREECGYPLEIYYEGSAMIYAEYNGTGTQESDIAEILIRTHGLAGQYLKGACSLKDCEPLLTVRNLLGKEDFCRLFHVFSECIFRGVSDEIWEHISGDIKDFGEKLCEGFPESVEKSTKDRLKALLPSAEGISPESFEFFEKEVFPAYSLWYFQSAMEPFGFNGAAKIIRMVTEEINDKAEVKDHAEMKDRAVRYLNFYPLSKEIHYDSKGRKRVNIYKQRIIEKYLSDPEYGEHVSLEVEVNGQTADIAFRFVPACAKLTEFCLEAEQSGLLTYEKSISRIFDIFGFRRDRFDRLADEARYLETLNWTVVGTSKLSTLDWVNGDTVVDVGSGGGVLLEELERRFPNKTIIGTDISENVIQTLLTKQSEHRWKILKHNIVFAPLPEKVDDIIFSSILHEIYSYTETEKGKFNIESVKSALANAAASLNPGGRIIIRDSVKANSDGRMKIIFLSKEGMNFFKQFVKDFRGMDEMPEEQRIVCINDEENYVITDINYGKEFLYTYTWGLPAYPHEVQECLGYFTVEEFRRELEKNGLRVLYAQSILEPGYPRWLAPLVRLEDPETGEPVQIPDSTCIAVAEKRF